MRKLTFASLLLFSAFSIVSHAQYRGAMGSTWNNPMSAMINVQMWNNINNNLSTRMGLKSSLRRMGCTDAQMDAMDNTELLGALSKKTCSFRRVDRGGSSPMSTPSQNSSAARTLPAVPPITFRPSGGRIMLPQIVAGITNDRSEQQKLIQVLNGAIDRFETSQREKGAEYDLASAMSFFVSVSIYLQDTTTEINSKGGDALTNSLREALGPKAATISNGDRQQFYEALLTYGMLFAVSAQNADGATLAQLKQTSAELSQTIIGLDVTKYRFVTDGLVSVK